MQRQLKPLYFQNKCRYVVGPVSVVILVNYSQHPLKSTIKPNKDCIDRLRTIIPGPIYTTSVIVKDKLYVDLIIKTGISSTLTHCSYICRLQSPLQGHHHHVANSCALEV